MAYGLCDVQQCESETYMGWRPLTERTGRKVCEFHWQGHKSGRFDLYDAFGFKRPLAKTKPVKLIEYCECGRELEPGHRLCPSCAAEREKERKREYYHQSKEEKSLKVIKLRCKECVSEREPGHRYCRKCAERRGRKSNRERQRRHYKKTTISETA